MKEKKLYFIFLILLIKIFNAIAFIDVKENTIYKADYSKTNYPTIIEFENSRFNTIVKLDQAIHSRICFEDVDFDSTFFCRDCYFGFSRFDLCVFNQEVNFNSTDFGNATSFYKTNFKRSVSFDKAIIDYGDFSYTTFFSDVSFARTEFGYGVDFSSVEFQSEVDFSNIILPEYFNFSYCKANTKINLWNSKLADSTKYCKIYLVGSDIDNFDLDYNKFLLSFSPFYLKHRYNCPSEVSWEIQKVTYLRLLRNFERNDNNSSYKKLHIEYLNEFYKHEGIWIFGFLEKIWWNYGYNKEFIFIWTLGLLFVFITINYLIYNYLNDNIYTNIQLKNKTIYNSILYTIILFFGLKIDLTSLKNVKTAKEIITQCYIFIVYVVGFICMAYMLNFVLNSW